MHTIIPSFRTSKGRWARLTLTAILVTAVILGPGSTQPAMASTQIDIIGPAGSESFGTLTLLNNGNIVVVDPYYDAGTVTDVGAVYLYDGATGALISALTGSTAGDLVGAGGVTVLNNGNYVVSSPFWNHGAATDAGAVTWGNSTKGVSGVVSDANSLVGSTAGNNIGSFVTALSNGNYVVRSPYWDNGPAANAGAATWGDGTTGISGVVSADNSLVGSKTEDSVGFSVTELSNGNYVVGSYGWDNGPVVNAGAVTWGNGTTGVKGIVSAENSLVGSTTNDLVGDSVIALRDGNYVVRSPSWTNGLATDAGAVTWGDGTTGITGTVTAINSLVGDKAWDQVGINGVTALSNGNYVVRSAYWRNGSATEAGAVTWGDGMTGVNGVVSADNSLVGSTNGDHAGEFITALSTGNYVVQSPVWDNGPAADAGAVTWCNGLTGVKGTISDSNSLVGSAVEDLVGINGVIALSSGNYVVISPAWDNGPAADAGAVTWGDGMSGVNGAVSADNSLVGSTAGDQAGYYGVTPLSNGNYVVQSPGWDNEQAADAGAATWGNGSSGVSGTISMTNSLVGSTAGDNVGYMVTALSNGNYVVGSYGWQNGPFDDAGAATWGNGATGIQGAVTTANSLVGSTAYDQVGMDVTALSNGNYVVTIYGWDNGTTADVGAATWGNGAMGVSGTISAANSLVGSTAEDQVGSGSTTALSNGNYVVGSYTWHHGEADYAGATTWGNGMTGVKGVVSEANSLVGTTAYDQVGEGVYAVGNGNYVIQSAGWDNSDIVDAGAVTLGAGSMCAGIVTVGPVTPTNSVAGSIASGGNQMTAAYDPVNLQLVVARPAENIITLFRASECRINYIPVVKK